MRVLLLVIMINSISVAADLRIASKKFTESVILGEIVRQLATSRDIATDYRSELGGTRVLWNALLSGEIDAYPDYSGTIMHEILAERQFSSFSTALEYIDSLGITLVGPLGFNNTYAIGVLQQTADKYNLQSISDLASYPQLTFGFTNEFMDRQDGWPGLRRAYRLPQDNVRGLDHDLAYKALASATIDVMDLYSTDAEIHYYNLFVLDDDKGYFPEYYAYLLVRKQVVEQFPGFIRTLKGLENSIDETQMIAMNEAVKIKKMPVEHVAADFLSRIFALDTDSEAQSFLDRLYNNTLQHLLLVLISLSAAILVSVPLGIFAIKRKNVGQLILGLAGILQTIPSLALLVFMIPLLGIGAYPAMTALFLYSLLPIIRNTYSGINDIPPHLSDSARALGLTAWDRLRFVELPLAARSILAGIKTAAVINVGTATLGALIGAGGYGQPILTGIRLDDTGLILEGAIPAALLALVVQGIFDIVENYLVRH